MLLVGEDVVVHVRLENTSVVFPVGRCIQIQVQFSVQHKPMEKVLRKRPEAEKAQKPRVDNVVPNGLGPRFGAVKAEESKRHDQRDEHHQ